MHVVSSQSDSLVPKDDHRKHKSSMRLEEQWCVKNAQDIGVEKKPVKSLGEAPSQKAFRLKGLWDLLWEAGRKRIFLFM